MGRYVPRSGCAEQKTSRESCCGKTAIHHTCQPEFRRAKNCSFPLRRLGQNREAKRVRRALPVSHPGVGRFGRLRCVFRFSLLIHLDVESAQMTLSRGELWVHRRRANNRSVPISLSESRKLVSRDLPRLIGSAGSSPGIAFLSGPGVLVL